MAASTSASLSSLKFSVRNTKEQCGKALPDLLEHPEETAAAGRALVAALLADEEVVEDHDQAHEDAGADAAEKQRRDGRAGRDRIDDHRDGRGDDGADGTGRGRRCGGVLRGVAAAHHGGDEDTAERGHAGRAGAGNGGEEHGRDDGRGAEAAGRLTDDRFRDIDQALGNAGAVHQGAAEHEERHCQQGGVV